MDTIKTPGIMEILFLFLTCSSFQAGMEPVVPEQKAPVELRLTDMIQFRLEAEADAPWTVSYENPNGEEVIFFNEEPVLTSDDLKSVKAITDERTLQGVLNLSFTTEGAEKLGRITSDNRGRRLGIFIAEELLSAPVIQEAIRGGEVRLSGLKGRDEAGELLKRLYREE